MARTADEAIDLLLKSLCSQLAAQMFVRDML